MPTYTVQCQSCSAHGDIRLSFKQYDSIQDGSQDLLCNECEEGKCAIAFDPSTVQFILKDGESGGWASKAIKENKYRANRRQMLARKERDHVFKPKLQPNFRGVETGTWKDAKEYARSEVTKDHGTLAGNAAASTFNRLVEKSG